MFSVFCQTQLASGGNLCPVKRKPASGEVRFGLFFDESVVNDSIFLVLLCVFFFFFNVF